MQRERFFREVRVGDVFCCTVTAVSVSGIWLQLLCYATNKNREIDQLRVKVGIYIYVDIVLFCFVEISTLSG